MARRPRLTFEGAIHHVTFRGNGRQPIFHRDDDRIRFLESLEERIERYGVRLYLYCLMTNHVHLLVEILGVEYGGGGVPAIEACAVAGRRCRAADFKSPAHI